MKIIKRIGMLVLAAFTALMCGCFYFERTEIQKKEFDVMSFNIRTETSNDTNEKNWSNRKQPMFDYLLASDMDVICMQEVRKVQYEDLVIGLGEEYNVLYYPREGGTNPEGLAICYAKDFELVESEMFWLSETPDTMSLGWGASYYRICASVVLKDAEGTYLNIANVHLDHQVEQARTKGLELVLERLSFEYPTIVCGDFNTASTSQCYQTINEYMWDAYEIASTSDTGITYHNWGAIKQGEQYRIDYCFVSEEIEVENFSIMDDTIREGVYYSDHFAISTKIVLKKYVTVRG